MAIAACLGGLLVAAATPAPAGPLDGWSSDNVEFLRTVPVGHVLGPTPVSDLTLGAEVHGRYLYAVGSGLAIFDLSDPESPEMVSELPYVEVLAEAPDTNGKILLTSISFSDRSSGRSSQDLLVIDVSDPNNPFELARAPDLGGHTVSCVLRCRWAYVSDGKILDLRAPAHPRLETTNWCDLVRPLLRNPPGSAGESICSHDVTEVRPGFVLTASVPMFLLDARNPSNPRVVARSDGSPYSWGAVVWPRRGKDRWVLSSSDTGGFFPPGCRVRDMQRGSSLDSAFKTWDARGWRRVGLITGGDEYFAADGTFTDGNPPTSSGGATSGCAALWFDVHPRFHDGGLLVAASTGNGVKFLDVSHRGEIAEVGFWLPVVAPVLGSWHALWISDEIVYAFTHARGMDILRFTGASA